ncbi:MAG: TonB family protein [Pyrinomonadaceae bacterium]
MRAEEGNLISADASLIRAASNGDAEAVKALLAEGADVDQRGRGGQTALMVAAIFSHVEIARLLLAGGADVRLKDNLGLTARAWAARRGSAEVADLIFNDLPEGEVPSEKEEANEVRPKVEANSGRLAAEGQTSLQQLALRMTKGRPRTSGGPQRGEEKNVATSLSEPGAERIPQATSRPAVDATSSTKGAMREVEAAGHASEHEAKTPPEPDTLRFMKFHKQIMAAQQRRQAEQERHDAEREYRNTERVSRNTEDAATSVSELEAARLPQADQLPQTDHLPQADNQAGLMDANLPSTGTHAEVEQTQQPSQIETNTEPLETDTELLQDVTSWSEQGAVATWPSTDAMTSLEPEPVATPSSTDATFLSEQGAVATWSSIDVIPPSEPKPVATPSSADATFLSEQGAVATWSSTDVIPPSEQAAAATWSPDSTPWSDQETVATPSSTDTTPLSEQQSTRSSTDLAILSEWDALSTSSSTDSTLFSDWEEVGTPSPRDATLLSEPVAVATWPSTDTPLLSEQGAVATWSSTDTPPLSEQEVGATSPSADATSLSEQREVSPWSSTDTPPLSEQEVVATSPSADATSLSEQREVSPWSSTDTPPLSEQEVVATSPSADATSLSEQREVSPWSSTDASLLSEQGAVATWSGTDTPPQLEQEAVPTPPSTDASLLSEQGAVATWSGTDTPPPLEQEAVTTPTPSAATLLSELEATSSTETNLSRPTASQLSRIAATIDHLRILEDSRQRPEVEVPPKSERTTPAERELDHDQSDITLQRSALPIRPTTLEPKTLESSKTPPVKRCPQCNATYGNPVLTYCAYDATKLVTADHPLFGYSAQNDRSRQTLWALVAIIAMLGASLGYLLNNYRSRDRASNPPVAEVSTAPVPARVGQPETAREGLPLVGGELSGMELDVPQPEYPVQARTEGVSGTVTVRVQVNQRGRVIRVRSSGGDSRLRAAAVEAAQKATFSAEKLAAQGKTVSGTITYNFAAQTESATATGSPAPAQANSPSAIESSSALRSSDGKEGQDYPVVGGPLAGAENNLPQADYPETARSRGIDGTVTVTVRVNRAGKVISWRTSKADSRLRAAALKAAQKATFSPEKLPGTGEIVGTITYNFKQ